MKRNILFTFYFVALATTIVQVTGEDSKEDKSSGVRAPRSISNIARLLLGGNVPPDHPLVEYPEPIQNAANNAPGTVIAAVPGMNGKKSEFGSMPSYPAVHTPGTPPVTGSWPQNNQGYNAPPPVQQQPQVPVSKSLAYKNSYYSGPGESLHATTSYPQPQQIQASTSGVNAPGNYYNAAPNSYSAPGTAYSASRNAYDAPNYGSGRGFGSSAPSFGQQSAGSNVGGGGGAQPYSSGSGANPTYTPYIPAPVLLPQQYTNNPTGPPGTGSWAQPSSGAYPSTASSYQQPSQTSYAQPPPAQAPYQNQANGYNGNPNYNLNQGGQVNAGANYNNYSPPPVYNPPLQPYQSNNNYNPYNGNYNNQPYSAGNQNNPQQSPYPGASNQNNQAYSTNNIPYPSNQNQYTPQGYPSQSNGMPYSGISSQYPGSPPINPYPPTGNNNYNNQNNQGPYNVYPHLVNNNYPPPTNYNPYPDFVPPGYPGSNSPSPNNGQNSAGFQGNFNSNYNNYNSNAPYKHNSYKDQKRQRGEDEPYHSKGKGQGSSRPSSSYSSPYKPSYKKSYYDDRPKYKSTSSYRSSSKSSSYYNKPSHKYSTGPGKTSYRSHSKDAQKFRKDHSDYRRNSFSSKSTLSDEPETATAITFDFPQPSVQAGAASKSKLRYEPHSSPPHVKYPDLKPSQSKNKYKTSTEPRSWADSSSGRGFTHRDRQNNNQGFYHRDSEMPLIPESDKGYNPDMNSENERNFPDAEPTVKHLQESPRPAPEHEPIRHPSDSPRHISESPRHMPEESPSRQSEPSRYLSESYRSPSEPSPSRTPDPSRHLPESSRHMSDEPPRLSEPSRRVPETPSRYNSEPRRHPSEQRRVEDHSRHSSDPSRHRESERSQTPYSDLDSRHQLDPYPRRYRPRDDTNPRYPEQEEVTSLRSVYKSRSKDLPPSYSTFDRERDYYGRRPYRSASGPVVVSSTVADVTSTSTFPSVSSSSSSLADLSSSTLSNSIVVDEAEETTTLQAVTEHLPASLRKTATEIIPSLTLFEASYVKK